MKHTVEEVRLKNGARGLLIDVPGATVMSFEFQFRAGNRYVKHKDIYETAHLMEHMAFGANSQFKTEHEFEAEFTKNGAYHNAYTSDLSMVYMAECADFEWERILKLQEVSICQPKFNEEELVAEKGNVRSELTGYLNNHIRLLWPKAQQLLGEDILTFNQRIKTIPHVTLRDIREHHKRTHTSENMRFVIAGRLQGRKAEIRRQLEDWPLAQGEHFVVPHDELHSANASLIRRKEASNITFGWSNIIPRVLDDTELDAMACLNHLLTGTMHSRIFGTARKKGVSYNIFSDAAASFYESSWDFGGQVNHESAQELFVIIRDQIKQVLDGEITQAEIDAAKSYALGRHQMGAQTVAQISNFYTSRYFGDGVVKDYEKVPDSITNTSLECMIETAREFINADTWVLAAVGSGEKAEINELNSLLEELYTVKS
ncbi:insulinase family protein [Candidatus Saccharibacteria bacterium]|nr:insulinase family protein [Candidatus Saccharibacteria bacterium]MBH2007753.1 insulinase family protein [Candidatus Saccharibacteria bacterium]